MITKQVVFDREVKVFTERPKTITEILNKVALKYPDKEAIVFQDIRLTYKDLKNRVDYISVNLQKRFNVNKGDRIALLLNNCVEYFLTTFACSQLGAIIVPLNTRLQEKELAFMLRHSGAKLIIVDEDFKEKLDRIQEEVELPDLEYKFLVNWKSEEKNLQQYFPFEVLEISSALNVTEIVNEEDPLLIMYTSGTTGTPKGAILSHIGVVHSVINFKKTLKTNHNTKTLIAVPLFHVTGLIGQLLHMVFIGGTSVLISRYQTEVAIKIMDYEKISFLFNVPTMFIMLMSHPLFKTYNFSFVKTIASGGSSLSLVTINRLRESFPNAKLHNAYGATETSSPTTIMPVSYQDTKIASVGLPVPVAELKIVNEEMEECTANEIGELLIKGPMVVKGYWNNDKANSSAFIDGYWLSGDIAMIDEDGFVYIMDRKKDMINRGGEKIFSIEVENALYNHPAVLEAAVVGIPDQMYGEQIKAFIVKRVGEDVTGPEIQSFLAGKLANYKIPKEVAFVTELPKNPGGKVLKNVLMKF
ncbi:class I adenylate-forming enzyme family protein [Neobacillus rhizophilus]|uniref:Acyl--CoA ligase n=1 Tax=Neobacillus rhizophilus TaxID=2833579 RepID=A0A942YYM9_9BACI|nr:class I adenylate-forming enzyme family protein [Neobacillus rhizophilus]MBS4215161.1 acyl--CoA ligase [Neobacillus rhizophilus]